MKFHCCVHREIMWRESKRGAGGQQWWKLCNKLQLSLPVNCCHSIRMLGDNCFFFLDLLVRHSRCLISFYHSSSVLCVLFSFLDSTRSDDITSFCRLSSRVKEKNRPPLGPLPGYFSILSLCLWVDDWDLCDNWPSGSKHGNSLNSNVCLYCLERSVIV